MRNVYHVQTPENVSLEFELAGPGSRGVAVAIDTAIQSTIAGIITLILYVVTGEEQMNLMLVRNNTFYIVLGLLVTFALQFGYFFLFEAFMKGATPGKRLVGLKVMMADGEPLSISAALIRNFIRIGDMLPGIYAVGILSVVFNRRYMRVGDMAANTVVVKVLPEKKGLTKQLSATAERRSFILTQKEEALLNEYRERTRSPRCPVASDALEAQLYHHFYNKIGLVPGLYDNFTKKAYLDKLMEYLGIS